jgi:Lipocalin-like domain
MMLAAQSVTWPSFTASLQYALYDSEFATRHRPSPGGVTSGMGRCCRKRFFWQVNGYAVFTQEGRAFFILTGELREPATNDEQRVGLLNTLVAYTGTYRVEGDKWITKVEVAWNPEWVGSEQTRFFKLDGDRLQVLSPWRVMPNWPGKGMTRSILTFDRSK